MIFEQLSLEYWMAGRELPWNIHANPEPVVVIFEGEADFIKYDLLMDHRTVPRRANSGRTRFNLKG